MDTSKLAMSFLGVGNASAVELGNSSCVLEANDQPILMIDCGPTSLVRFKERYAQEVPPNLFITHLHMDHVGGLEALFFKLFLSQAGGPPLKIFVPTYLITALHQKFANATHSVAEGGVNWWDVFHLIPVEESFWLMDSLFKVFPVRHFAYRSAFGLCLPGSFVYTGDTRPIPEILSTYAAENEIIFHDADITPSPAHSGVDELLEFYTDEQRSRIYIYHYASESAAKEIKQRGFKVVQPGATIRLNSPASAPHLVLV